jgi:hypothetical protein
LQLYHLLVGELATVVEKLERLLRATLSTRLRLGDEPLVNGHDHVVLADEALEVSLFHVRDDWGGPDDHALD